MDPDHFIGALHPIRLPEGRDRAGRRGNPGCFCLGRRSRRCRRLFRGRERRLHRRRRCYGLRLARGLLWRSGVPEARRRLCEHELNVSLVAGPRPHVGHATLHLPARTGMNQDDTLIRRHRRRQSQHRAVRENQQRLGPFLERLAGPHRRTARTHPFHPHRHFGTYRRRTARYRGPTGGKFSGVVFLQVHRPKRPGPSFQNAAGRLAPVSRSSFGARGRLGYGTDVLAWKHARRGGLFLAGAGLRARPSRVAAGSLPAIMTGGANIHAGAPLLCGV